MANDAERLARKLSTLLDLGFTRARPAPTMAEAVRLDPTVASAREVLAMTTSEGARALGMGDRIGSLVPGKLADLAVVETRHPRLTPMYDPVSHLVYAARSSDVRHVMVGGDWVVRNRQLLTFDLAPVMADARDLATQIQGPASFCKNP